MPSNDLTNETKRCTGFIAREGYRESGVGQERAGDAAETRVDRLHRPEFGDVGSDIGPWQTDETLWILKIDVDPQCRFFGNGVLNVTEASALAVGD